MRIYNRLIISLAIAFGFINILLAFLWQDDLTIYFIINDIAYLIITLLYVYLNPRAKSALNNLSAIIFVAFIAVVAMEVMEILK
jgi:uncharacterized membrane protein YjjP (DUF1212 family)